MTPKEIISHLVRQEFDKNSNWKLKYKRNELIKTAEEYKLECLSGMINDN